MANRTTFLFFTSWAKQLRDLPREQRCDVYDAIIEYAENGTLPTNLTGEAKMAFKFIQCDVDASTDWYKAKCERNRENIKKRWERAKANSIRPNTTEYDCIRPNTTDTDEYDSVPYNTHTDIQTQTQIQTEPSNEGNNNKPNKEKSPNGDNKKKVTKQFERPTLEEVQAYIAEKHYSVDPEMWFSYYESNGWKVGRCTMKDWRRAIVYWESKNKLDRSSCDRRAYEDQVVRTNYGD